MIADTKIVNSSTGEVIAFPGDELDGEDLYRLEVGIGLPIVEQALTDAIRLSTAAQVHLAGIQVEALTDNPEMAEAIVAEAHNRRLIERMALK
jgi:hypothetical protein